jgi:glyoxylase-like metal-dependent hydrolase (beta-lactamase superfamily II)
MNYLTKMLFTIPLLFFITAINADNNKPENIVKTPYGDSEVTFKIQQVKNTPVYYVIGLSGVPGSENEGHTSNAGFVITDKGVVVYDALGTPILGYQLLSAIKKITNKAITIVIASHYHADHVYGLQAFKEHTKATIIAQESAYIYINDPASKRRLEQRQESLFPWVNEKTYLVKPTNVFAKTKTFDMGDTKIELIHAGTAHSPDDTIMIVKKYGVVFTGDLIFAGRLPFLGGENVNTKNWLKSLNYLQQIKPAPQFIIPGHGAPDSDPARSIAFTKNYIIFLRDKMGAAVQQLNDFSETYKNTNWSLYKQVKTFTAANRGNAYRVFLEMESELFE